MLLGGAGWSPGAVALLGGFLLVGASLAPLAPGFGVSQPPRGGGKAMVGTAGSWSWCWGAHPGDVLGSRSFSQAFWGSHILCIQAQPSPGKLHGRGAEVLPTGATKP